MAEKVLDKFKAEPATENISYTLGKLDFSMQNDFNVHTDFSFVYIVGHQPYRTAGRVIWLSSVIMIALATYIYNCM